MAGQNIERREVLRILTIAAGVASFPGFSKWAFACGHIGGAVTNIRPAIYHPIFFDPLEYATIERLADIIIPADTTPGASQAGVAEFIDLIISRDVRLQLQFRNGLAWLDTRSHARFGASFLKINPDQQRVLLDSLAYQKNFGSGEEAGRAFFKLVREYTVMGFYTSEIGLKELDYPGLKFYAESPECPHKGDPEHRHLPPPKE